MGMAVGSLIDVELSTYDACFLNFHVLFVFLFLLIFCVYFLGLDIVRCRHLTFMQLKSIDTLYWVIRCA